MKNKILVTGGAGYIGSKLSYDLTDMGFKVVVFDNLSTGSKKLLNKNDLITLRPEKGISSKNFYNLINKKLKKDIKKLNIIRLKDFK